MMPHGYAKGGTRWSAGEAQRSRPVIDQGVKKVVLRTSGRMRLVCGLSVAALAALMVPACSGSSKASSNGHQTGNSDKSPYLVGLVWSRTGAASDTFMGALNAFQARIDLQNAEGGVNGHPIRVDQADDQTSPTGNLTATEFLMAKNPLVMAQVSPLTFASARIMHQAGMPVVGPGTDGPEWGQQPYTNMFSVVQVSPNMPEYQVSKQEWGGAKSLAVFGYGTSPASIELAKAFAKAAQVAGLSVNYIDTSLPFGTVNVTPIALAMKEKKIDGVFLPLDVATNLAIFTAARQEGVNLKTALSGTGYGQTLLDQPASVQAAQGVTFAAPGVPVELKTPATLAFQKALATYAHFTGVPGSDYYAGWAVADLAIRAIQAGGSNPTHQSIITKLRKVTVYTVGGLLPTPTNFADFGQAANLSCAYWGVLRGTSFVITNHGHPTCTHLLR